jgi:hypothetical protein
VAIPARGRATTGRILVRPVRQVSELAERVRPRLTSALTRWLGSERCVGGILARSLGVSEFRSRVLVSRGQRRVIQVDTERGCFVLHPSLRRSYVRKLEWAWRLTSSHGVPVARLADSDSRLSALLRHGAFFALFDFVAGRPLERDCSIGALREVADLFGRLHSIGLGGALPATGPLPPLPRGRSLAERLSRWERMLGASPVSRGDPGAPAVLRRLAETLPRRCAASLVHGDAHLKNLLERADGGVVLLDLEGLERGLPLLEVVFLMLQLDDPEGRRRTTFLERYLASAHDELRNDWAADSAFWFLAGRTQILEQQLEILDWSEKFGDPAYTGRMRKVCEATWHALRASANEGEAN